MNSAENTKENLLIKSKDNDNICIDINADTLNSLFETKNLLHDSFNILKSLNGVEGLLKLLKSSKFEGIDPKYNSWREMTFGKNLPIKRVMKSLVELILECFKDEMLIILLIASFVSLIIGIIQEGIALGWLEGVAIFFAVFVVVSITSYNNYTKDLQFLKLIESSEKKQIRVLRNSYIEIDSKELHVGDIICYQIGDIVNNDCILLEGFLGLDESSNTGESLVIEKNIESPFLVSGSNVVDGNCQALVCTVGENTVLNKNKLKILEKEEEKKTPLQEKLEDIVERIGYLGKISAILIFVIIIGKDFIIRFVNGTVFSGDFLKTITNAFILGITVVVVAIPEGLPMAVTISFAYSVMKMKEENNLVKTLDSSETMGNVNMICSDKTGTITEGVMKVSTFCIYERLFMNDKIISDEGSKLLLSNLSCAIINNSTAFFENKVAKGNPTEVALLNFLIDNNIPLKYEKEKIANLPLKSEHKFMCTIYFTESKYKVYIKGAPEIIINFSKNCFGKNDEIIALDYENSNYFLKQIEQLSLKSNRTLAVAFTEIAVKNIENFNKSMVESSIKINSLEYFTNLLNKHKTTLLGIFGILDPPRKEVKTAIKKCNLAGVKVIMVTGDYISTALSISKDVGIITEDEFNYSQAVKSNNINLDEEDRYAMTGEDFQKISKGYETIKTDKGVKYKLNSKNDFEKAIKNLKVLVRAVPDDKFLLVMGLRKLKNIVAVTGDGTNDALALKVSDVGFAMGKRGTEIAQEAADIILLDDSFASVITAIKYGRNIFDGIRKFLQFQLTTNIVAIFMTLLGGIFLRDSPLNAIQMLWVNLIMDSFASLALATEPPSENLLERLPYSRNENIVTKFMMNNIVSQSFFQIIVLIIVLFYGDIIFDVNSDRDLEHYEWKEAYGYHFTLFFNIFVFLQIFNSLNSRKLTKDETDLFSDIKFDSLYVIVQGVIFVGQLLIVTYGGRALRVRRLTIKQHFVCIFISSFSLVIGYITKYYPIGFGNKELDALHNIKVPRDSIKAFRENSFKARKSLTFK